MDDDELDPIDGLGVMFWVAAAWLAALAAVLWWLVP